MQNRSSPPPEKKGIPRMLVIVPTVIVGLVAFWLILIRLLIPWMGFRPMGSGEDISEKPLPKRKAYHVNLYIQSNVGGADVYVNGEKKELGTRSLDLKASVFGLRPGTYEIQLKKEGYQDAVKTVELTGDNAVETIIMELEQLEDNP